jgi:2-phosphoglycolate phosphatase
MTIKVVLFDLDGTLLDTAPDLAFAINKLLEMKGRPALPFSIIRPLAGHGGRGLVKLGFNITEDDPQFADLWQGFLALYREHICQHTCLFPGLDIVLNYLTENKLTWGIVTNKPGWLTEPLLQQLKSLEPACVVSGDTLPKRKPDPEPLLHACQLLNVQPSDCVYIGDSERDIQAAKSAGMPSLLAHWGYLADTDPFEAWQADGIIRNPKEIIDWLITTARDKSHEQTTT